MNHYLTYWPFSTGHCIACPSSSYTLSGYFFGIFKHFFDKVLNRVALRQSWFLLFLLIVDVRILCYNIPNWPLTVVYRMCLCQFYFNVDSVLPITIVFNICVSVSFQTEPYQWCNGVLASSAVYFGVSFQIVVLHLSRGVYLDLSCVHQIAF